ncbi:MAG: hypothetical protein B6U76_00155 [Desulfurococcales archaeon ex4484_217_2]|nr:MAG: hypothetical protein B6U76_00155 [Desulfurococcales archaeon ex4484_217_2]
MSKKASVSKLNKLHDKLADYFTDVLDSGEELSGGTLAAINTFLKVNDITADVTESSPMQNLSMKLQELVKKEEGAVA